jgi:hypothetical protein
MIDLVVCAILEYNLYVYMYRQYLNICQAVAMPALCCMEKNYVFGGLENCFCSSYEISSRCLNEKYFVIP